MGVDKGRSQQTATVELRRLAEERLRETTTEAPVPRSEDDIHRLLHELQVHQLELEMQNNELLRTLEELELSRNKYAELYDFAPLGYFVLDAQGQIQDVNLAGAKLLDKERTTLVKKAFSGFIADSAGRKIFSHHLENVFQESGVKRCEIRLKGKDGILIHGQLQSVMMATIETGDNGVLTSIVDVTTANLARERIREVLWQQQALLDHSPDAVWLKGREGRYAAVNKPFCVKVGKTPKDLIGKTDFDIYPSERAEEYEKVFRTILATGKGHYCEESQVAPDGNIQHLEMTQTPIFNDSGEVIGVIGVAHDFTIRKRIEVALRHESTHDNLTGLYNRAFFEAELERFDHGRLFPLSIVIADINGLKVINDTLGHNAGDTLIQLAARIMLKAFRAEDIVARIGGDEFAVLLPRTAKEVAEETVERIMGCPEIKSGQVSIAFGIAAAENGDQLADVLKLSDTRMYRNKSDQKGRK